MITAGASAYPRILDFPRLRQIADSVDALLFIDMAHIAGLVAGGQHPSPIPHAHFVTTTTHKSLRGPRGGIVLCEAEIREGDRFDGFPWNSGRPAHARDRGESGLFSRSAPAAVPRLSAPGRDERQGARRRCEQSMVSASSPAAPTIISCWSICGRKRSTARQAQEVLDRAGITVNKNAIPFDTYPIFKPGGIRIGTPAVTTRGMKEEEMLEIADLIAEALDRPR